MFSAFIRDIFSTSNGIDSSAPSFGSFSPTCRVTGACNDNAACTVRYSVTVNNFPVGAYVTIENFSDSGTGATVFLSEDDPAIGVTFDLIEPNNSGFWSFDIILRDSGANQIATSAFSTGHQSFWNELPLC